MASKDKTSANHPRFDIVPQALPRPNGQPNPFNVFRSKPTNPFLIPPLDPLPVEPTAPPVEPTALPASLPSAPPNTQEIKERRPLRIKVATSSKQLRKPSPEPMEVDSNDASSDVTAELGVADTPTSSQQALAGNDDDMEEDSGSDDIEVIDGLYRPVREPVVQTQNASGSTSHSGATGVVASGVTRKARVEEPAGAPGVSGVHVAGDHVSGDHDTEAGNHPVDLMSEISHLLQSESVVNHQIHDNLHRLDAQWSLSPGSNAAYHLINATTQIQKDLSRTVGLLHEMMEIDKILSEACKHADEGINKIRKWDKPTV